MFCDSQAITQTLIYGAETPQRWESLKAGSNCCGLIGGSKIIIPQVINENLKCLKEVINHYETEKLNKGRNVVRTIPVWGAYLTRTTNYNPELSAFLENVPYNLFQPPNVTDPDFWDGTYQQQVADLNRSPNMTIALEFWNTMVIPTLTQVSTQLEPMGGQHPSSPFLSLARYANYFDVDFDLKDTPEWKIKRLPKESVKIREVPVESDKRSSTGTKKPVMMTKRVYAPSGYTMESTVTEAYSAVNYITDTHKEYLPQLIIPVFDVSTSVNRGIVSRMQVQGQHINNYKTTQYGVNALNDLSANRAQDLSVLASLCVTGTAGQSSALALYYKGLGEGSHGGWLGDIFAAATPIVKALGF